MDKNHKFKVGDKVKIIGKPVGNKELSVSFKIAHDNGSKFYVAKINGDGSGYNVYNCIVVDSEKGGLCADYFAPKDLKLVKSDKQKITRREWTAFYDPSDLGKKPKVHRIGSDDGAEASEHIIKSVVPGGNLIELCPAAAQKLANRLNAALKIHANYFRK